MRFKKGSEVEVLNTREGPSGSWWRAKIVSGDGQSYRVRYDRSPPEMGDAVVERVSVKLLRPCPPLLPYIRSWIPGDIVEVYDIGSWKLANILKIVGGSNFYVRLVDLFSIFKVHISNLRTQLSWHGDRWVMVGKDSVNYVAGKNNRAGHEKDCFGTHTSHKTAQNTQRHDCFPKEDDLSFLKSRDLTGKKRTSQMCPSQAKKKCISRGIHQIIYDDSFQLPEKVEVVASSKEHLCEKYMHASYNTMKDRLKAKEREKSETDDGFSLHRSLKPNTADSSPCSTCSSIGSNDIDLSYNYSLSHTNKDLDYCSDVANSFSGPQYGRKHSIQVQVDVNAEVRKLELHAYSSTLEVLYASGSITWEQEALMTDLRLMLHISNDEHLLAIRQLASGFIGCSCTYMVWFCQKLHNICDNNFRYNLSSVAYWRYQVNL